MTVIGVTGPSGAGKGELSQILASRYGFLVLNADEIYHNMVSAPSKCLDEIRENFGDGVINGSSLNRRALSELVFGDENRDKLVLLNKITHKHVVNEINRIIESNSDASAVFVIDAPLLIEAGICPRCDFTISVIADKAIRAGRIASRDGISIDLSLKRINSQKDDDFYISNTDYCIKNNSDLDSLSLSIHKILSERRVIL